MCEVTTGTEFYEMIQNALNNNIEFVTGNSCISWINWILLAKKTGYKLGNISINLTEYRRICSLFQSLGMLSEETGFDILNVICECDDFEMCAEWMRYHRNKHSDFYSDEMVFINKYAEKFDLDVRDMFRYMYNDDDGEYLKRITEFLVSHPEYPNYTKGGFIEPDSGRHFSIFSLAVKNVIHGKLIV